MQLTALQEPFHCAWKVSERADHRLKSRGGRLELVMQGAVLQVD